MSDKEQDNIVKKLVKYMDTRPEACREPVEQALAAGATWEPGTPSVLFWFGRTLLIKDDGTLEEL